jgi:hypothetical protein
MFDFNNYLLRLDDALRANNATEHTHRPAFKRLLEEAVKDLKASTSPRGLNAVLPTSLSHNMI